MGRSNTLPITEPPPSKRKLVRSGSSNIGVTPVPASKSHHHVHIPFTHRHEENVAASAPTKTNHISGGGRPGMPQRQNSVQTRYMDMLLALDTIPRLHNILASFFCWILLAGFVIFPGTFTSIQHLKDNNLLSGNDAASQLLNSVKNAPLLVVAGVCCGIGAAGLCWLWWRWRQNYVWLLNRIFLPACLNSLAGLLSSIINVYGQQDGNWSLTAEVTTIVTGSCLVITAALFIIYNSWVLQRVKNRHGREMEMFHPDEGLRQKVGRKAMEPALEPGSVV